MVLHSCACVYLWYASTVATLLHFMFYVIKIENRLKQMLNVLCWSVALFCWFGLQRKQRAKFGSSKTSLSPQ